MNVKEGFRQDAVCWLGYRLCWPDKVAHTLSCPRSHTLPYTFSTSFSVSCFFFFFFFFHVFASYTNFSPSCLLLSSSSSSSACRLCFTSIFCSPIPSSFFSTAPHLPYHLPLFFFLCPLPLPPPLLPTNFPSPSSPPPPSPAAAPVPASDVDTVSSHFLPWYTTFLFSPFPNHSSGMRLSSFTDLDYACASFPSAISIPLAESINNICKTEKHRSLHAEPQNITFTEKFCSMTR